MAATVQAKLLAKLQQSIEWSLIDAGTACGVFDFLVEAKTTEDIAQKQCWHPNQTRHFLNALVSIDILVKYQNTYQLSPDYQPYLSSSHPQTMVPTLQHLAKIKVASPGQILAELTPEKPSIAQGNPFTSPGFWQRAVDNLRAFHLSISCDYHFGLLTNWPNWSNVKRLLDLGAGSEILSLKLLSQFQHLQCHLFDLPEVTRHIREHVSYAPEGFIVHSGDYNKDPLPVGFDLIFASMSLYYADNLAVLLQQIYQALETGGCFVSLHEGLTDERTQPTHHVIGRLMPTLRGNDVSFIYGEIARQMSEVGFRIVQSKSVNTPFGPMELDIGYK